MNDLTRKRKRGNPGTPPEIIDAIRFLKEKYRQFQDVSPEQRKGLFERNQSRQNLSPARKEYLRQTMKRGREEGWGNP